MNMNFYAPTKIITDDNCVINNPDIFSSMGKNCLIVTGKTSAKKCGALDDVLTVLEKENITYSIFDEIAQNPSFDSCKKASDMAKEINAEFIIGIGGGSPLDASKAIAVLSVCRNTSIDTLYSLNWDSSPLPIIAVGTTAGTGSEVTPVSVITLPEGIKKSFKSPEVYPRVCFGDAKYTMSLSVEFTRSTALDALCHCTESYFNRATNEICRTFSLRGISILKKMLLKTADCDKTPLALEDRKALYCASLYGGFAISVAGTTFPHGMGYFLSEQFNIPHGNACAVYIEDFINYNDFIAPEQTKEFFYELQMDKESFINLVKINMPKMEIALTEEKLQELLPRFKNNKNLDKCYGNADCVLAESLLRKLFM